MLNIHDASTANVDGLHFPSVFFPDCLDKSVFRAFASALLHLE